MLPETKRVPVIERFPPTETLLVTFKIPTLAVFDTVIELTDKPVLTEIPEALAIKLPLLTFIPLLKNTFAPVKLRLPVKVLLSVDKT